MQSSPLHPHSPRQGFHTFSLVCYNYSEGSAEGSQVERGICTSSKQPWRLTQPGPGLTVMTHSSWLVSHCTCVLFSCLHQSLICLSWQTWQVEVLDTALTVPKCKCHIKTSLEDDPCEINWLTNSTTFFLQNNSEMPDLDAYICFQLCFICISNHLLRESATGGGNKDCDNLVESSLICLFFLSSRSQWKYCHTHGKKSTYYCFLGYRLACKKITTLL